MAEYMVLDVNTALRRVAVLDRASNHHILSVPEEMPERGEFLLGPAPAPPPSAGPQLLVGVASGQVYRATFEASDCDQVTTFEWLHPDLHTAPPRRQAKAGSAARTSPASGRDTWDGVFN